MLKVMTGARYLLVSDQSSGAAKKKRGPKRLIAQLRGGVAGLFIDRIVAVSNFVKKRDIEALHLRGLQIKTIYNGVELEEGETVPKAPNDILTIAYAGQLIAAGTCVDGKPQRTLGGDFSNRGGRKGGTRCCDADG
jgi:hypothetical protein